LIPVQALPSECHPFKEFPLAEPWIAFLHHDSECSLFQKAKSMQASGAKAMVIMSTESIHPDTMDIPMIYIADLEGQILKKQALLHPPLLIVLIQEQTKLDLVEFLILTVLTPAGLLTGFLLLWWYKERIKREQEKAPVALVAALPVIEFHEEHIFFSLCNKILLTHP
jgi:positive regulator of sigma E activity